jgi:hypothetical protein
METAKELFSCSLDDCQSPMTQAALRISAFGHQLTAMGLGYLAVNCKSNYRNQMRNNCQAEKDRLRD